MQQPPEPHTWEIASAVISAAATLALAFFGGVQIWRERRARIAREVGAAARISATGYLLRQRIRSWNNNHPGSVTDLNEWIRWREAGRDLEFELGAATASANEMMSLVGDARAPLATSVRRLFVTVVETTQRLRAIEARHQASVAEVLYTKVDVFGPALDSIDECLSVLEGEIIESTLLEDERLLKAPTPPDRLESGG